jgi:hypothetical protein
MMRVRLTVITLSLLMVIGIIILLNTIRVEPKPPTSLGVLWVNKFKIAKNLRSITRNLIKTTLITISSSNV